MVIMRTLFLVFMSFVGMHAQAQISLTVSGQHVALVNPQKRVYQVQVGTSLECTIEVTQSQSQNPQISFAGGDGLVRLGVNTTYQSFNGNTRILYGYQFLAPKEGRYTLGPVSVTDGQNRYETEAIEVEVVKGAVASNLPNNNPQPVRGRGGRAPQQSAPASSSDTTRIVIEVDDENPYINQPVVLTVKHYFSDVLDYQTMQPKVDGLAVKELGAETDARDKSGKRVIQKSYLLTPISSGKKTISPVEVHYLVPRARQQRPTGDMFELFLSDFMDLRPEQKKALSNELVLNVRPLPAHKKKVDAVGIFTSFKAVVDRAEVPVYETVKYTLRLEGEGNMEQVTVPKLSLPADMKIYESKSELTQSLQSGSLEGERKFEFVLQPRKPGSIEIPAQKFTFFNYKKGEYQTISTEKITLEVTGSAEAHQPDAAAEEATKKEEAKKIEQKEHHREEQAIKELVSTSKHQSKNVPWHYFMVLIFLLPLALFWRTLKQVFSVLVRKKEQKLTSVFALERVRKMSEQDIFGGALHKVMVEVLCTTYGLQNYSSDNAKAALKGAGFNFDELDRFMQFMDSCAALPFSTAARGPGAARALQQEASQWLERLSKKSTTRG